MGLGMVFSAQHAVSEKRALVDRASNAIQLAIEAAKPDPALPEYQRLMRAPKNDFALQARRRELERAHPKLAAIAAAETTKAEAFAELASADRMQIAAATAFAAVMATWTWVLGLALLGFVLTLPIGLVMIVVADFCRRIMHDTGQIARASES
jgi:2-oxo-4-hydroxy-4-carboxy--5-ureidoimidazoline (OHCU) decarboxylase